MSNGSATGPAFAINAMIEADRVEVEGAPVVVQTPSNSGKGQKIARCPTCWIALWSNYASAGDAVRFVRVGTLAEVAEVAAFLVSDRNSYMNGATVVLDGGV